MGLYRHELVNNFESGAIVFGMSRELDEQSLIAYLQRFTDDEMMELLSKRLSDDEIEKLVDHVTGIMRRHLSDKEYHSVFLKDS